jgi:hypothetical protein
LEFFVSPRTIAGARKKISCDDPRTGYFFSFLLFLFLLPHSVSAALRTADLPPIGGLSILLPSLPLPPFCRLIPAMFAAVTRHRMFRPENTAAAFKQTYAASWSASTFLLLRNNSFSLIFAMS